MLGYIFYDDLVLPCEVYKVEQSVSYDGKWDISNCVLYVKDDIPEDTLPCVFSLLLHIQDGTTVLARPEGLVFRNIALHVAARGAVVSVQHTFSYLLLAFRYNLTLNHGH